MTDVAIAIVDDSPDGFASLTLAAVAARAGVAVPSLYKHVGSLADLRASIALAALRELGRRTAAATVGLSGEDALRALGHALRAFAREHPGMYSSTQVAADLTDARGAELERAGSDVVAIVAAVLRGFGLPESRTVDAVRATRAGIHGFVELEAHGGFGMPDDVDASFEALLDVLVAGVRALAVAS